MLLRWQPVAALGSDECYLVSLRLVNTVDNQEAAKSLIAQDTCNSAGDAPVSFTVSKKSPAPDFEGLLPNATAKTPVNYFVYCGL